MLSYHKVVGLALVCAAVSSVTGCSSAASLGSLSAPGFNISGDPESAEGATWTFSGRVDGVDYDLSGVLYKPSGPGPFPAVLLSHGSDGNAAFLASALAPTFVSWGLVCIAPNYTHSTGVPIGAPGDASEPGASDANVRRAHMTYDLLRRLGYVDMSRVAAHGHSMGAYVDAALLGAYPADFRAASSTGGGVRPSFIISGPAPSLQQTETIRTPFQMHHGDADEIVSLAYDQRFDSLLAAHGVAHQLFIYPGADHLTVRVSPLMLERVRDWYTSNGMFSAH